MIYPHCVKNGPKEILRKAGVSYTKLPAIILYEIALISAEIYSEGIKDGLLYGRGVDPFMAKLIPDTQDNVKEEIKECDK